MRDLWETLQNWKKLGSLAGISFLLLSAKCTQPMPDFSHKVYTGDPDAAAFVRKQDNEIIPCTSEQIRKMKAVKDEDYLRIYTNIQCCEKWRRQCGTIPTN